MEERFGKLNTLYTFTKDNYYEEVSDEQLETGMYKGLLAGLEDPYSYYMTDEETQVWMDDTTGSFVGIGVTSVETKDKEYFIVEVIPDTPAEKAGLKIGDQLLKVDGKACSSLTEFSNALRGKKGSKVDLTYQRGKKVITSTLTREEIIRQSVTSKMLEKQIGYIKIQSFQTHTAQDFEIAASKLKEEGAEALVIDLRNNGGGLTESSIKIADLLLGKGVITYMEDRNGNREYHYSDKREISLPYALIVNEKTASASELLAAAVKDSGRKVIVGTQTFGKGIVQQTTPLKTGDSLKMTIAQYFSPKGNVIHKKGVTPDYIVKNKAGDREDSQLKKAMELLV